MVTAQYFYGHDQSDYFVLIVPEPSSKLLSLSYSCLAEKNIRVGSFSLIATVSGTLLWRMHKNTNKIPVFYNPIFWCIYVTGKLCNQAFREIPKNFSHFLK